MGICVPGPILHPPAQRPAFSDSPLDSAGQGLNYPPNSRLDMVRIILLVVVVLFLLVGGLAILLFQFFGWKGLIAFPFIMIGVIWVGKKIVGSLIKKFALGLFSMKSGVLREATMTVHSGTAVPKPPEPVEEGDGDEEDDAI